MTEDNPMIGELVGGRYRITRVIGEGGMGIVYEGEQKMGSTTRKVAIKTLHAELSKDPSVTKRFHRECGTVAQLEHPNTIRVYDFGTTSDGTLYIAMEYLDGEPLDRVIEREGALDSKRVLRLLKQISGSLDEAHRQGIVHRDLKPENVVLTQRAGEKDVVKILDFGIAARTESADAEKEAKLTQQGMVLGTPPYMSPEQFTGKALDKRSDIYSLGIMVYEMLTGTLPFEANTPWEWATQHMTAQPKPFEALPISTKIPTGMQTAILKALSKDREDRYASVPEFVEALEKQGSSVVVGTNPELGGDATAAMDAVPDFGVAGPAPTAAMPAQSAGSASGNLQTGQGVAIPAPPPITTLRGQPSGTNKGLIFGLAGVAALLLGGIGVAMVGGGGTGDAATAESSDLGAIGAATEAPTSNVPANEDPAKTVADTPVSDAPQEPDAFAPGAGDDKPAPPRPKTGSGTAPTPPKSGADKKPPPKQTEKPKEDNKPPSGAGDSAACTKCAQLAARGQIEGAAGEYAKCSDSGAKATCSTRARRTAAGAASRAKKAGDCPKVLRIAASAHAMGAGTPNLDSVASTCR